MRNSRDGRFSASDRPVCTHERNAALCEFAGAPGDMDVLLISGGALLPLYRAALQIADRSFEEIDADDAVRRGLFTAGRNLFLRGAVA